MKVEATAPGRVQGLKVMAPRSLMDSPQRAPVWASLRCSKRWKKRVRSISSRYLSVLEGGPIGRRLGSWGTIVGGVMAFDGVSGVASRSLGHVLVGEFGTGVAAGPAGSVDGEGPGDVAEAVWLGGDILEGEMSSNGLDGLRGMLDVMVWTRSLIQWLELF